MPGLTLEQLQAMGAQPKGTGLTLEQIKAKQVNPISPLNGFQQIDAPTQGASSGIFSGPLSLLAAPGQVATKAIAQNIVAPAEEHIQKNIQSMQKVVDAFIYKANNEPDLEKKQKYIQQAREVMNTMKGSSGLVDELNKEALARQRIDTPVGTIPALSNDPSRVAQQVIGRGLTTTAFLASELGPTASGALLGAGSGLEEGKSAQEIAIRTGLYAFGGKILGYGLDKVVGTNLGQRILSSTAGKALQNVAEKTTTAKAIEGSVAAVVSDAFKTFGDYANKALSPSTYINPIKDALKPVGEVVGVLRTPEQKLEQSQQKIESFWDNAKQRYQTATRYGGDAPKILAREGIIPDAKGGEMLTANQEQAIRFKAVSEHGTLDNLLESSGEFASLDNVRSNAIQNINANFQGVDRQTALNHFNKEYDQFLADHVSEIVTRENGEKVIQLRPLNDFKSYLWSQGYPSKLAAKSEQIGATTARLTGNAMKTEIENAAKGIDDEAQRDAIINLNNRLGELYRAANFLKDMNGKKLPFGLIGRHFARLTGAVIGSSGGVAGSVAGALTADYLVDVLSNPKYSVGQAAQIIAKAQKEGPEVLIEAQKIIERNLTTQSQRLRLPKPSVIYGQPYKGGVSTVTDAEKAAFAANRSAIAAQQNKDMFVAKQEQEVQAVKELRDRLSKPPFSDRIVDYNK